ncbi:hypothetical protein FOZ63_003481 [Perkinsus olseni]|uniref:Protein kinase domain-containing protein n=1 Tax=Perkinsus olseni TaxID=32597 RepID=A0A7J6S9G3_PEROL|nr:hypothetical protein FOZ63_003481 [Perkinsus olseni]
MPAKSDEKTREAGEYCVNEGVRYYSLTYDRWVDATVVGLCDDPAYVHLDVKRRAKKTKIRRKNWSPVEEVRLDDAVTPARSNTTRSMPGSARQKKPSTGGLLSRRRLTIPRRNSSTFNPNDCLPVLVSELGLQNSGNDITISSMRGFTGGMNGGIWFVKTNGDNKLCLKLVSAQRKCAQLPTEAGNYIDLAKRFPFLLSRSTLGGLLAFPVKIFDVAAASTDGSSRVLFNLIVMPVARGVRLAEILGRKVHAREDNSRVLEEVGRQLRRFHERINGASGKLEVEHTDFQPCNIFVDEPNLGRGDNGGVTFVDLGGMGVSVKEGDYEHFVKSLTLLGQTYGPEFVRMSAKAFTEGYGSNTRGQRGGGAQGSLELPLRHQHSPWIHPKVSTAGRVISTANSPSYRITRAGSRV